MRKLIRKFLNQFGYDIVKLPPQFKPEERKDLKKLFTRIYDENLWGGDKGEFYSGPGSEEVHGIRYAEVIKNYIHTNGIKKVLDIGCGDFRIARQFVTNDIEYMGVDVVPSLIANNQQIHGNDHVQFKCIDATTEELPDADLCLIRQVFQHLSNEHINIVLEKCKKFPYLIISEHTLIGDGVVPNLDMEADWNIRIEKNSCILLEHPPFNKKVELLLEIDPQHFNKPNSRIRTTRVWA